MGSITFYSVPINDVSRYVSFSLDISRLDNDASHLCELWNNPDFGHVLMMSIDEGHTMIITNRSNEPMGLFAANHDILTSSCIGIFHPNHSMTLTWNSLVNGIYNGFLVLSDIHVFTCTAYLHRKKIDTPYYTRVDDIILPKGVYTSIGHLAAVLNQQTSMRGERNGYIFQFISHKGRLSIESSHKQPEPSFLEVIPHSGCLGLIEETALKLRTKERIDFPFYVATIM